MSMTFTKLFSSITESTIWMESDATRIVWIAMLAMADHQGRVWASIPGLAHCARVDLAECQTALAAFLGPDPYSRTNDYEGRRIEAIDGGWKLLNYKKFREMKDVMAARESKRKWAEKNRKKVDKKVDSDVDSRSQEIQEEVEVEVEVEVEAEVETHTHAETKPKPKKKPKKNACAWPDGFVLTDKMAEYARSQRLMDPGGVFESFRVSALAKGYKYVDWESAWQSWCRSHYQDRERTPLPSTPAPAIGDPCRAKVLDNGQEARCGRESVEIYQNKFPFCAICLKKVKEGS